MARLDRFHRLVVFETAARLESFTGAAAELGMTQPAITQHVRSLERSLGRTLFDRSPNRVRLNPAGGVLLRSIQQGFDAIESGIAELDDLHTMFVLACNPGIAQSLLVPRLGELQEALGDLDVRLWLFDREAELILGRFDAVVHLQSGDRAGLQSIALFPEQVLPVASPDLASALGLRSTSTAALLPHDRLLHLDSSDRAWMTWSDWFNALGEPSPDERDIRVSYNNHALLMQDVVGGRGIGLAWRQLSRELLAQEVLVQVGEEVEREGVAYQLSWPESTPHDHIDALREFLLAHLAT